VQSRGIAAVPELGRVAAIVLAAGRSTRMRGENKLLIDLAGKPLLRHAVESALLSAARPVLVVAGHQARLVRAALAGLEAAIVDNPEFASGLSSSLKAGIRALPPDTAGALIALGDMPSVSPGDIDRLIEVFLAAQGQAIVVPVHAGERGNPVLWPAAHFAELLALEGDAGGRRLFARHAEAIKEVAFENPAILLDVDTPQALAQLRASLKH
jgi:molybdenum cofactor cytidylyltransferase